jgi:hypothetical protein
MSELPSADLNGLVSLLRDDDKRGLYVKQLGIYCIGRPFDYLVTHAVVKRAYVELRERAPYLKRLAFWTITEEQAKQRALFHLTGSNPKDIDVAVTVGKSTSRTRGGRWTAMSGTRRRSSRRGPGGLSRARRNLRFIRRHTIRHWRACSRGCPSR